MCIILWMSFFRLTETGQWRSHHKTQVHREFTSIYNVNGTTLMSYKYIHATCQGYLLLMTIWEYKISSVEVVVFIALIQRKVMFLQYKGIFTTLKILSLELQMWCFHNRMAAPDSPWISGGWRPALNQKYQDLWAQGQNHPGIRSTSKYFLFLPLVQFFLIWCG